MTILAPKNDLEFEEMIDFAIYQIKGPVAIRYPRSKAFTSLHEYNSPITYGKAEILYNDPDSTIAAFAIGSMVSTAITIKEKLKEKGINLSIINGRFAKPIDFNSIEKILENKNIKSFIVLEENVKNGGIGQEIENYIYEKGHHVNIKLFSLPDAYVEHGSVDKLHEMLKIDSDSIVKELLLIS